MELDFYLKSSTGKSYSNIKITQRPYVNEGLNVANICDEQYWLKTSLLFYICS